MNEMLALIDQEIEAAEQRAAGLRLARDILAAGSQPQARRKGRTERSTTTKKPQRSKRAVKASPKQLERVETTLADTLHGRASQVAITKASGLNSGAVSAVVRKLESDGKIRRTGEREGRSHVYELVGAPAGAAETEQGNGGGSAWDAP